MSRGIHAEEVDGELISGSTGSLLPCYFGCAPIWHLNTSDYAKAAGGVFVISSITDAIEKIGNYKPKNGIFTKPFSLCEAVNLHFGYKSNTVGPIIVAVNTTVISIAEEQVTSNIAIVNGTGEFDVDGLAVLSSVAIAGKTKGIDYTVAYDETGNVLVFKDVTGSLENTVQVTYSVVTDLDSIIMGAKTFENIDYFEQQIQCVPTVIAAPLWEQENLTETTTIADKLIEIAESQINTHWYTQAYINLASATKTDAILLKSTKGYDSPKVKITWPCFKNSYDTCIYDMSVAFIVAKMSVDLQNDNIPYESASNEKIQNASFICDAFGTVIKLREADSSAMNDIGICTANYVSNEWRTWGCCMANYLESAKTSILPESLNDVAVQMRDFICNEFQKTFVDDVDKPISVRRVNEIVEDFQEVLDTYVTDGKLLYAKISYEALTAADIADGNFIFNISETNTPPGKSITARVRVTTDGLSLYDEEEEEEE